ncbi:alternate-type signal peptide domain-containing protein [Cellulosimicrobium sp. PMB13]|uniref:alternate-type signal peptide domain-containing protein n=1 Tax=Cellulosimicrobium sp. PMB13 TaxID=3120158 RepID=UPI003F4C496C
MTTTTKNNHGAVKGSVAAAAGIAVLLGGAGTFALWNANGAIGTTGTETGSLTAEFGDSTTWEDVTAGAANPISDITDFRMVPGDTVVGTTTVDVTATGENLLVDATLDSEAAGLPEGVTATVVLTDGGTEVTSLRGSNAGETYNLSAAVTLTFDASTPGSMTEAVDLSKVTIDLQQRLNA